MDDSVQRFVVGYIKTRFFKKENLFPIVCIMLHVIDSTYFIQEIWAFMLLTTTILMMLSVILVSMLIILLPKVWSGIWLVTKTRISFWTWIWSVRHCVLGHGVAFYFSPRKTQIVSLYRCVNTDAIDVKMDLFVLEWKLYFKMLKLSLFSKLGFLFLQYLYC